MNTAMKKAGLAAAVLATGLAITITSNPAAAIEAAQNTFPERDDVLIETEGYFLGGDGFTDGAPDEPATLTWDHSTTFGTAPTLEGKVHFDGASNCARVVLVALNRDGSEMGPDAKTTSDVMCPATTGHHVRTISEGGVAGLDAKFGADKVKVILQTEPRPDTWSRAGSQTVEFGPRVSTSCSPELGRAPVDRPGHRGHTRAGRCGRQAGPRSCTRWRGRRPPRRRDGPGRYHRPGGVGPAPSGCRPGGGGAGRSRRAVERQLSVPRAIPISR